MLGLSFWTNKMRKAELLARNEIEAARNAALGNIRVLTQDELAIALSEAPAPRHGSAEAQVYAFACKVFRDHGPDEASKLADRFVYFVQMMSREPHQPHTSNPQGERA